jgi:transposase-like protein
MKLIDVTKQFSDEEKCFDYIEKMRWPHGVCCVHCGVMNVSRIERKKAGDNKRKRIFQCLEKECGKQFSATSGTIFNDTHLPLYKWFMAIAIVCEAKKGVSAKQLERHLGVNYRTAWHMAHRIREAMQEGGLLEGIVETDTTWMTPRKPRKGNPKPKNPNRSAVLGMIERGGRLRLVPVADEKVVILEPVMKKHLHPDAFLQTDMAIAFDRVARLLPLRGHRMINHILSYAQGANHTNSIENAFSLLKRGIYGTFHKVSVKHLARYCNEFSYRFNRREAQLQMFGITVKNLVNGKALPYAKLVSDGPVDQTAT